MNPSPDEILAQGAKTFKERNAVYGDNFRNVGAAMKALHPQGIVLESEADFELFHLHMLIIVKLSRFANSMLQHQDSIHDVMVYAAMCDAILQEPAEAEKTTWRAVTQSPADHRGEKVDVAVTGEADFDPAD